MTEEGRQARVAAQKAASAIASKDRKVSQLEDDWNEERTSRLETEERCAILAEQVESALRLVRIYEKACEIRNGQIAALEAALAEYAESLLTYRDYYGTSVTQAKHLAECPRCYDVAPGEPEHMQCRCSDYPTE